MMKELKAYRIAIKGLKIGIQTFHYELDSEFFSAFEQAPFTQAKFKVDVEFDKRSNLFILKFDINGKVDTSCDRCLANIKLPVKGNFELIVKLEEEAETSDPDIIYLDPAADYLDLASTLYDFINLSVPMHMTYDCEYEVPRPCDEKALNYLEESEESLDIQEADNSIWEALKKFNNHS
jgi:uncharacterized metal-binding protein YceD (DUF177 family)